MKVVQDGDHRLFSLRHLCTLHRTAYVYDENDILGPEPHEVVGGIDLRKCTREEMAAGDNVLHLDDVSIVGRAKRDSIANLDLTVRQHEIVGVAGVSGNGQSALAGLISGLIAPATGTVHIDGNQVLEHHPRGMIHQGVGRIPEDRHHDGIVGDMSVAENMVIERLDDPQIQSSGLLRRDAINANAERLAAEYDVRGPGIHARARLLSGGNIQKMILARVFEQDPKLILANQPTRGLDMGAAAEVARRLLEARARGAGILLISDDLDEILSLADRILVIHDGQLVAAKSRNREEIGLMMAGRLT